MFVFEQRIKPQAIGASTGNLGTELPLLFSVWRRQVEFSTLGFPVPNNHPVSGKVQMCHENKCVFLWPFCGRKPLCPVCFPGLVLVDGVFLPDVPVNREDDAPMDPLQLSDPTVTTPCLPAQLCLAGRLTLPSRHFHGKPIGLGASSRLPGACPQHWVPLWSSSPPSTVPQLHALTVSLPSSLPSTEPQSRPQQRRADRVPPCWEPFPGAEAQALARPKFR